MAFVVQAVDEANSYRLSGCENVKQLMERLFQFHSESSSKSTGSLSQKCSEDVESMLSMIRRLDGKLESREVLKSISEYVFADVGSRN